MSSTAGDFYFVSYSRIDAADFVGRLADALLTDRPSYRAWIDTREIQPGRQDWDDQLVEAIRKCVGLLFVVTEDSVRKGSVCKDEWDRALKYKKPVVPLLLRPGFELPFRLGSRQYVDFSHDFDTGLARLRNYLRWTTTPEGVLQELETRLADAERELPRVDVTQQPRIEQEIEQLRKRIADQSRLVENPEAAREQTEARIAMGLELQRQPERPEPVARRVKFVNPAPMTAPGYFQDRHVETELIADFVRTDGLRMMSVVGRGGVGKTAMICRLLKGLEAGQLPDDLGELPVDGIVYLSPLGAHAVSFPNLFTDLCRLLDEDVAEPMLARYRDPTETPATLMLNVLEAFPAGRNVVLLDNFEDVLDPATFEIGDRSLNEALMTMLTAPAHGVKVVITSRAAPRALLLVQPAVQRRLDLDAGLDSPYAEEILRAMDPTGALGLRDAPDELLTLARERTRGFPRALEALAAILGADRDTTLPELLADAERMPENVVEALVGEAFNRLDPLAQQVMQALAVYAVPVPAVAVDYLLQPYQPAIDSAPVLSRLVNTQFVRRDAGRYYLHQVDRDYALQRVSPGEPADTAPDRLPLRFTQYALRDRGADYFQQTRTPRETWRTLDDLAPQLTEFDLRFQADDYDAAADVLIEIHYDYLMTWGHYRLAIDLHERLLGRVTDRWIDALIRGNLGSASYHAGETERAIELYEQALALHRELSDMANVSVVLGLVANCHDDLGDTRLAIDLYEQALELAREVGERPNEAGILGNLGTCYSKLGDLEAAIDYYEQARAIERELGDRGSEAIALINLGEGYGDLGEPAREVALQEEALELARNLSHRRIEAVALARLGAAHGDLGDWERAIELCKEGIEHADAIGLGQGRVEGRLTLATAFLHIGDAGAAAETAAAIESKRYPPSAPQVALVLGIALLGDEQVERAKDAFEDALRLAEGLVAATAENYKALDAKALALCGLAILGDPEGVVEASATFLTARTVVQANGIVARVLRLLDLLAAADREGVLQPLRRAAAGAPA